LRQLNPWWGELDRSQAFSTFLANRPNVHGSVKAAASPLPGLLDTSLATARPTVCRCPACSQLIVNVTGAGASAGPAAAALGPDLTFKLHSNPTANQRIYLDFDGYSLASSEWEDGAALQVGAFYGSPFSAAAHQAIQDIWRRVAEDFAPFNIDVTTEEPTSEDLKNSGAGDSRWGIRVAMTTNTNLLTNAAILNAGAGSGGSAFLGSFNWATDDVCLVFNGYNATDAASIYAAAETVSHEVGHSLGLSHDGGSFGSDSNYYEGHGSGATSWGTIMGAPFIKADENVTTWSQGDYIGANNQEDDLGLITGSVSNAYVSGNGFTYRDDDYGNSLATAYTLSGEAPSCFGIIERNSDVDWFRFNTGTATTSVSLSIRNACRVFSSNGDGTFTTQYLDGLGPNLAISAQLFDASGVLIATSTPLDRLDVNFNLSLAAGDYYLSVEGVGFGSPLANPPSGFSDYGSLGQYLITSTIMAPVTSNGSVVITAISDNIGTITGPIANGGSTNDTTPTLTGTIATALAAGSTIRVYRNDVDAGNATVIGTSWSYTPATALTSGAHRFKAAKFIHQQFFIDGFYYLSCFNCRILVKVLTVVGFYVKTKFSCCVVPDSVFNLYSTIFKNHTNPLTIKILINLKLGKTVACDLGAGAFGHCESQQIVECSNLSHRFYTGIVSWLNPINIFPILFGVVVLNTTQQQVFGYSINGRSHSVYGPQSFVGTVCDHKIFVAQRYLTKILIR
jgi:hypothetical protein